MGKVGVRWAKRGLRRGLLSVFLAALLACVVALPVQAAEARDNSRSDSASWEVEPNNQQERATPITLGTTYHGETNVAYSDNDYYRVSVSERGTLRFYFTHEQRVGNDGWSVLLLTEDGMRLTSEYYEADVAADGPSMLVGVPAGIYYVLVDPIGAYGLTYDLKVEHVAAQGWELEPNDSIADATSVAFGQEVRGTSSDSHKDLDFFKVTLSEPTSARITLTNEKDTDAGGWRAYLIDASGKTLAGGDFHSTRDGVYQSESVALRPGDYYIKIEPRSAYGKTYVLKLGEAASDSAPDDKPSGDNPQQSPQTQTMYRLYNPYTGEHFYTANAGERDTLKSIGWTYEGVGWVAPTSGDPVYRLFNPYTDDHHYTTSAGERDALKGIGWRYEGVGWCSGGSVPVLRQFNPYVRTATHNYTVSREENDKLVSLGWREEGTGWYAVSAK